MSTGSAGLAGPVKRVLPTGEKSAAAFFLRLSRLRFAFRVFCVSTMLIARCFLCLSFADKRCCNRSFFTAKNAKMAGQLIKILTDAVRDPAAVIAAIVDYPPHE